MSKQKFTVHDPNFRERIMAGYKKQAIMQTFGASVRSVEPGIVEMELPFREDLTQQHGFFHAGVVTMMDNACGYAGITLLPPDMDILTIEFKANFLSPAVGERLIARGVVAKAGRTITVANGEAIMVQADGRHKTVAQIVVTLMGVRSNGESK